MGGYFSSDDGREKFFGCFCLEDSSTPEFTKIKIRVSHEADHEYGQYRFYVIYRFVVRHPNVRAAPCGELGRKFSQFSSAVAFAPYLQVAGYSFECNFM